MFPSPIRAPDVISSGVLGVIGLPLSVTPLVLCKSVIKNWLVCGLWVISACLRETSFSVLKISRERPSINGKVFKSIFLPTRSVDVLTSMIKDGARGESMKLVASPRLIGCGVNTGGVDGTGVEAGRGVDGDGDETGRGAG